MPAQADLFRQCVDEAVQASSRLIATCVDAAATALAEAENHSTKAAERRDLCDALRELVKQRAGWIDRYPRELRTAIEAGPARPTAAQPQPSRIDMLTLVNDDQVDREIEALRLSQLLQSVAAQPLGELDAMVSSVLGLPAVRPEENPLRPDVFARVLRSVMAEAPQAGWPGLWIRHMAPTMGRELEQLYCALTQRLTQANVHAATYRILPLRNGPAAAVSQMQPQPQPPRQASGTGAPASNGLGDSAAGPGPRMRAGSAWADLQSTPMGDELIQNFLFRRASQDDVALAPAYYARVSTELARLEATPTDELPAPDAAGAQRYARLPAVDRPQRPVSTDTTLSSGVWGEYGASRQRSLVRTRLKQQARHADQVLGLEVVRKLVNQVAQDPRLLTPVRESIVALEPSLLRLAMVDPRFFGDEEHPGRRLVERVADRSLTFNDEFSAEFNAFSASVAASFNELNALSDAEVGDPDRFQSALAELEASWAAQDQAEAARRHAVLDAVRFAEQRQAQADQIAWELSQRGDLEGVPTIVQDFIYGSWALVMAHARLSDGGKQVDPGAHGGVVTDLLWSVKRDMTLREPARLIEMLPGLLGRLRTGLAALGQAPQEADSFFQALEQLHRPVLRLRAKKRREDSDFSPLEPDMDRGCPEPAPRQHPKSGHSPWMGRQELDAAGFQDTLPTDHGQLEPAPEVSPEAQDAPMDVGAVIAGLREGCWVDLYSRRHWLRAKLVWASTKGTLFMFVSHGGQPHSMTRRSCERLLRDRLLRPVEMHGAVSHAIDMLAQAQPQALAA
jgi:hypothetical protein